MYETGRRKTSPAIYVALIASWIIILGGVWWIFFSQNTDTGTDDTTVEEQTTRYFMGEQVLLEGTLAMADDISQFSHILTTKEKQQFGLKSFDIALNGFTGIVQVKGEVSGFKQQMPIIQVADVIGLKGSEDDGSGEIVGSNGSYTYIDGANLGIDLSVFPGYTLSQLGNDIEISDGTKTKLITIKPFRCTPGDATKDCTVLKSVLDGAQRFTNAAGMVFYNLPETDQWVAFKGTTQGYNLLAEKDVQLQTYASIFEIIDPAMFDTRLDEVKPLCKDINSRLMEITSHETVIESDGSVKIGLDGTTSAGVAASCVVTTSLSDPTSTKLFSYTGPTAPENPTQEGKPTPEENTVPSEEETTTNLLPTKVSAPDGYTTWTTYPSVRGRTMYVEKNIVSYDGQLGTGQVGCPYRLDLSYRNNATGSSADSIIYECASSGVEALKSMGYTTIGVATGVEFLRKDVTDTLKGVDVYIQ